MAASVSATVVISLRPFTHAFNTNFGQGGHAIANHGMSLAQDTARGKEMQTSSGNSQRGFGSKIASRLGLSTNASMSRSRTEKSNTDGMDLEDIQKGNYRRSKRGTMEESSESIKGLTERDNVILTTTDYHVEYEEAGDEVDRNHQLGIDKRWERRS